MHHLWQVPELLTYIILFLDAQGLEASYLVCRLWRNTLKQNIPPHHRPLPDLIRQQSHMPSSPGTRPYEHLPASVREYAKECKEHEDRWAKMTYFMGTGDEYFFWREGVYENLLDKIRPSLHPFLEKHVQSLRYGSESISQGCMAICLETSCSQKDLSDMVDTEASEESLQPLTAPACKSVQISIVNGAEWDASYTSFCANARSMSVRVEREKGVRLGDVADELRGGLIRLNAVVGDSVALIWRFS